MKNKPVTTEFKSFYELLQVLPTDESCREYLENMLWSGEPVCPHCGSKRKDHFQLKTKGVFKGLYKCKEKECRKRFTVTVGTMFEGSHIPLRKWFIAIYIFTNHKKGISSIQLAKDLGLTQKSAWFVLHRIRNAYNTRPQVKFSGIIQADESFIGGKSKNKHVDQRTENTQGRSTKDKTPVFGMMKNGNEVQTYVVPNTKGTTLKPIIESAVKQGSLIITDEWGAYNGLENGQKFNHVVLNHKNNEYVRGGFHTNGIENFWSHLKRGIYGIYHQASPKHLHRYCNEFTHRYNTRLIDDSKRFEVSLKHVGAKLTYKELIAKNG